MKSSDCVRVSVVLLTWRGPAIFAFAQGGGLGRCGAVQTVLKASPHEPSRRHDFHTNVFSHGTAGETRMPSAVW